MNKIDDVKEMRLQDELNHIDLELVEMFARAVLDDLVRASNDEIFSKHGGELSLEIALGPPNAGVGYLSIEPLNPRVMIRLSMITDIYRDALTFPLISRQLIADTEILDGLHGNPHFEKQPFLFESAVPQLQPTYVHRMLAPFCEAMIQVVTEREDSRLDSSDLRCRFIMFELMLAWTYFHELGHVVQRHIRFRNAAGRLDEEEDTDYLEFRENNQNLDSAGGQSALQLERDLQAQAREAMADAEAMDLTLKYLARTRRLNFPMIYLLGCSTSCMFQRFYRQYSEDLVITPHFHPHPAVRDEFSQMFLADSICDFLVLTKQVPSREIAKLVATYLTVRASLFIGLFRSHRIEARDDSSGLPSYMRLQTEEHLAGMRAYESALMPYIEAQANEVLHWHLLTDHRLNDWLQMLKAHQAGRSLLVNHTQ